MQDKYSKKLYNLSPFFWIIIVLIVIFFISFLSDIGSQFTSINDNSTTKNTIQTIFVSVCITLAIAFLIIVKNRCWNVPKFIIFLCSVFMVFGGFYLVLVFFLDYYDKTQIFIILIIESLILYSLNLEWYKIQLFYYQSNIYKKRKMFKKNNIIKYCLSFLFSSLIALSFGIWYKLPNSVLINRMMGMRAEWRKDLLLQKVQSETVLLGDYFLFNYKYSIITFIISLGVSFYLISKKKQ